jgi:hypothetical protein
MVLLPHCPFLPELPLDSCLLLEVPVPHLELGVTPLLRKRVDLVLVVPVVAHHLSPSPYCGRWNFIFIYIIKVNLLSWRAISLIKYNVTSDFN